MPVAAASIALVGGGSVATSYLHHLVAALAQVAATGVAPASLVGQVWVFEPLPRVGRGTAYADDLPSNLLNVTVAGMSVAGDDKLHFQRWLAAQGIDRFGGVPIDGGSFVSRALFGLYLEAVQADSVAAAHAMGVAVRHVQAEVTWLEAAAGGGQMIGTADGQRFGTDHVVLSLGNLPATACAELRGQAGYWHSPYPSTGLQDVARDADVCILGTGLSAVDAIVALAAQGHRGRLHALSRHGRLPCVRSVQAWPLQLRPAFLAWLDEQRASGQPVGLDQLVRRVQEEFMALAGGPDEDLAALAQQVPAAIDFIDSEIAIASSRPRPWQGFANLLNACIDSLWQLLDDADRRRFEAEIRPVWMSRRVSLPLENARILQRLLKAGQLQVSGGCGAVRPAPGGGFVVHLAAQAAGPAGLGQTGPVEVHADVLVNATGFSTRAESAQAPLLQQLLQSGRAVAHPFGGLRLAFDKGCLVDARGVADPHITVLGSMAAGTYFWTNAMEVNARLAMNQARAQVAARAAALAAGAEKQVAMKDSPVPACLVP